MSTGSRIGFGRACTDDAVPGYLQSMRNVGGDWHGLKDRGPLNIHEHVNFYAKASSRLMVRCGEAR